MKKEKKIEEYEATLIGKNGFSKVIKIKEPYRMLFIPVEINSYLETQSLYPEFLKVERTFILDREKSWKDKLVYKEIQPQKLNKNYEKEKRI